jgi:predicted hotdog family 3-hydroxylacyl-ACP dehydratase
MTDIDYRHPSEDVLRSIDIHTLLPQQEPFVMIDTLVAFDELTTVTETTINERRMFVADSVMTEAGIIENIAQTCAARIGYVNKYILKEDIKIGYIGAVRNMEFAALPAVGDTITTSVVVREEVFGVTLADATVTCNGLTLVTTEMKIAIK